MVSHRTLAACMPRHFRTAATALLQNDVFQACARPVPPFRSRKCCLLRFHVTVPVGAATVCPVPVPLKPGHALGRHPPGHMRLQCLGLIASFLLGVACAVCTRQPLFPSTLTSLCFRARSSIKIWLLRTRLSCVYYSLLLPASDLV